ncbi:DUF3139 domain-containing protein [Metaplanococcus flavidus]|uniref:DUF3139 domain-containing protein n=1 Tax=Metaplanococcus flavidus TaxID=569883 RepID=A0ABW3LDI1_9BACL
MIGILIVGLLILAFQLFTSVKEQSQIENDTLSYLENEGYEETDIEELYIVEILEVDENEEVSHTGKYEAVVHFKDEPNIAYFYRYEEDTNEIVQRDRLDEGTN